MNIHARKLNSLTLCLLIWAWPASAAETLPVAAFEAVSAELEAADLHGVTAADLTVMPGSESDMYEVGGGTYLFMVSADGGVLIRMNRFDRDPPPGEVQRAALRKQTLAWLSEDDMVIFDPPPGTRVEHTLTVFTDITCPFSRNLHQDVGMLNEMGVRVRYLAYPREGLESEGRKLMDAVWCHDNRLKAFNDAMQKRPVIGDSCTTPQENQFVLGESFGIKGTPAIIFEDGSQMTGYANVTLLLERLGSGGE